MSRVAGSYTLSSTTALPFAAAAERMRSIVGNDQLADTAAEVRRRLAAVVDRAAHAPAVSQPQGQEG